MDDDRFSGVRTWATSAISSYVSISDARLPLLKDPDIDRSDKHACPLCGGDLVPMGWFRSGDLHELLHKCDRCGLAVFR